MFKWFFDLLKKFYIFTRDKIVEPTLAFLFDGVIDVYGDPETRLWADNLEVFPELLTFFVYLVDIAIALTRLFAAILRYYGFFRHIELNELTFSILYYIIMILSISLYYFGYVLADDTLLDVSEPSTFVKKSIEDNTKL